MSSKELVEEVHNPIIRKFNKRKVYSSFIDNIQSAGVANIELINKFNKGFSFLLGVVDIYSKYAWISPLKDKRSFTITNAFQKILKVSNRKSN